MVRRHLDPYEERRQQDGVRARSYGDEEGQRAQPAIRFAAGCDQQRAGKHSESAETIAGFVYTELRRIVGVVTKQKIATNGRRRRRTARRMTVANVVAQNVSPVEMLPVHTGDQFPPNHERT